MTRTIYVLSFVTAVSVAMIGIGFAAPQIQPLVRRIQPHWASVQEFSSIGGCRVDPSTGPRVKCSSLLNSSDDFSTPADRVPLAVEIQKWVLQDVREFPSLETLKQRPIKTQDDSYCEIDRPDECPALDSRAARLLKDDATNSGPS